MIKGSVKQPMSEDRRKVLTLLEFILEMKPDIDSVYNAFVLYVAQKDEDLVWVSDAEWGDWLQAYADKLLSEARDV